MSHRTQVAYLQFGNDSIASNTVTRFLTPGYGNATASTTIFEATMPFAGFINGLGIRQNAPSSDADLVTYTVMINGVATGLAVTLAGTATTGSAKASASFALGDRIAVRVTKAANVNPAVQNVAATLGIVR